MSRWRATVAAWHGTADQTRLTGTVAAAVSGLSLGRFVCTWGDVDMGSGSTFHHANPAAPPLHLHPTPSYTPLYPHLARPSKAAVNLAAIIQDPQTPKAGSKDKKSASSLGFQSFPPHFLVHPSP
ncbi:hypothetical protein TgHK011_010063 [Trichoderma gracile]|nr:hypothetical protein TgHK011_010063 [Trichoderma gracile]